jgi:hypothetical protein
MDRLSMACGVMKVVIKPEAWWHGDLPGWLSKRMAASLQSFSLMLKPVGQLNPSQRLCTPLIFIVPVSVGAPNLTVSS